MSDTLRRFIPRATRYVLRPQDQKMLRFSHQDEKGAEAIQETTLVDLSKTGLAFLIEREDAPLLGDLIKVEFAIPGGEQMAWWARVVRCEEHTKKIWWMRENPDFQDLIMIGVQFQNLPQMQQSHIQSNLDVRLKELMIQHRRVQMARLTSWFIYRGIRILLVSGFALAVLGMLYYLSLPSENYDAERGAPWGQRFKIF